MKKVLGYSIIVLIVAGLIIGLVMSYGWKAALAALLIEVVVVGLIIVALNLIYSDHLK